MPLSKARMRERKATDRLTVGGDDFRVRVGECLACHRIGPIHKHHPDYSKPNETIALCASCHKKVHMYLNGTVRTGYPYKNPLLKLVRGGNR